MLHISYHMTISISLTELTHEQTVKFNMKRYYAQCVLCLQERSIFRFWDEFLTLINIITTTYSLKLQIVSFFKKEQPIFQIILFLDFFPIWKFSYYKRRQVRKDVVQACGAVVIHLSVMWDVLTQPVDWDSWCTLFQEACFNHVQIQFCSIFLVWFTTCYSFYY
jgi:hypothetical protein